MALLVSDVRTESFEKPPPPKKKWIQDYLEKDCKQVAMKAETMCMLSQQVIGDVVQDVIDQFQDYIDVTNKKNSLVFRSNVPSDDTQCRTISNLLDPSRNGAKFNRSLEKLIQNPAVHPVQAIVHPVHTVVHPVHTVVHPVHTAVLPLHTAVHPAVSQEHPPVHPALAPAFPKNSAGEADPPAGYTQQDIGGVVQGVISKFLNGSLAESGFRRSRKQCRKHQSCKGRTENGSEKRKHEFTARYDVTEAALFAKVPKLELINPDSFQQEAAEEENGALNLSLPKNSSKVTFAPEDRCYSTDSLKFSETSKSQEMYNREGLVHAPAARVGRVTSPSSFSSEVLRMKPTVYTKAGPGPEQNLRVVSSSSVNYLKPKPISILLQSPELCSAPVNLVMHESPSGTPFSVIQPVPPLERRLGANRDGSSSSRLVNSPSPTGQLCKVSKPYPFQDNTTSTGLISQKPGKPKPEKGGSKPVAEKRDSPPRTSRTETSSKDETKKTSSSSRELHNKLEKNRRAHLKQCFDELATECELNPKKASNLTVIRSAYKYIMGLRRKERDNEKELAALVQEKIRRQQHLEALKREMPGILKEEE